MVNEQGKGIDSVSIGKDMGILEKGKWEAEWIIEKFHTPNGESIKGLKPYEVDIIKGNLLVNTGIQLMLDKLIGGAGTVFDNTNAYIGTGNSSTAASATDTDLLGASKERVGMEATFPNRTNQTMSWKSVFGTTEGNYEWLEIGIFNASTSGTMLNRKVVSKGTKSSSDTWTITINITIS